MDATPEITQRPVRWESCSHVRDAGTRPNALSVCHLFFPVLVQFSTPHPDTGPARAFGGRLWLGFLGVGSPRVDIEGKMASIQNLAKRGMAMLGLDAGPVLCR